MSRSKKKIHKSEFSSSKRINCALFFYVGIDDSQGVLLYLSLFFQICMHYASL